MSEPRDYAAEIVLRYVNWAHISGLPEIVSSEFVGEAGPYKLYVVEINARKGFGPKVLVGEIGPGSSWFLAYRGGALHAALYQAQLRLEKRQRDLAKKIEIAR